MITPELYLSENGMMKIWIHPADISLAVSYVQDVAPAEVYTEMVRMAGDIDASPVKLPNHPKSIEEEQRYEYEATAMFHRYLLLTGCLTPFDAESMHTDEERREALEKALQVRDMNLGYAHIHSNKLLWLSRVFTQHDPRKNENPQLDQLATAVIAKTFFSVEKAMKLARGFNVTNKDGRNVFDCSVLSGDFNHPTNGVGIIGLHHRVAEFSHVTLNEFWSNTMSYQELNAALYFVRTRVDAVQAFERKYEIDKQRAKGEA